MDIALDCLGGDLAPKACVEGLKYALSKEGGLHIVAFGPKKEIEEGLGELSPRVEIVDTSVAVLNTDHPSTFFKEKPDSSLALAFERLRGDEKCAALVSAGPTGALLSGGILRIGRIPGVSRPALMATLPTRTGGMVKVMDAGANMDCKSEYLLQFAIMASTYLESIGMEKPRIGLLNVGSEEGKGNELSKEAYVLLKESGLNFVGSIEGDHVLKGEADAVICDGFAGNVFLKGTEEACYFISDLFKEAIFKNALTKIGALLQAKGLRNVKKPFDYAKKACAPLLGIKKLVLKCHGKSSAETFGETIIEAKRLYDADMIGKVQSRIAEKEEQK